MRIQVAGDRNGFVGAFIGGYFCALIPQVVVFVGFIKFFKAGAVFYGFAPYFFIGKVK